ncbi:MAG: ABC transporter substrate-binding protein [Devosia sp.]|nr:ABC transporter substrate-binding protein [Devosia sp.]
MRVGTVGVVAAGIAMAMTMTMTMVSAFADERPLHPSEVTPLETPQPLRISLNTSNTAYLAVLFGVQQGWFAHAGVNVELIPIEGSAATQVPLLVRGDIDMTGLSGSPSMYNQLNEGFDIKAIAATSVPKAGRLEGAWLTLRPDMVGKIVGLKDLAGQQVEMSTVGSGVSVLAFFALESAGLTTDQVELTSRAKSIQDLAVLAESGGVPVVGLPEPVATKLEQQGTVVRWKAFSDIAPWYQGLLLGVSGKYAATHADLLQKFLEVYVLTVREINKTDGVWTDELRATIKARTSLDVDALVASGGVPYFDPNVPVDTAGLERLQSLWVSQKMVEKPVDISALIATDYLEAALNVVGKL